MTDETLFDRARRRLAAIIAGEKPEPEPERAGSHALARRRLETRQEAARARRAARRRYTDADARAWRDELDDKASRIIACASYVEDEELARLWTLRAHERYLEAVVFAGEARRSGMIDDEEHDEALEILDDALAIFRAGLVEEAEPEHAESALVETLSRLSGRDFAETRARLLVDLRGSDAARALSAPARGEAISVAGEGESEAPRPSHGAPVTTRRAKRRKASSPGSGFSQAQREALDAVVETLLASGAALDSVELEHVEDGGASAWHRLYLAGDALGARFELAKSKARDADSRIEQKRGAALDYLALAFKRAQRASERARPGAGEILDAALADDDSEEADA